MFEDEFESIIDKVIGKRYMIRYREDMRQLYLDRTDLSRLPKINKFKIMQQIRQEVVNAKKRQNRLEGLMFIFGFAATLLGIIVTELSQLLSVAALIFGLLGLEMILRKVTIDIIAYKVGKQRMNDKDLLFRLQWNKTILKNPAIMGALHIVAFLLKNKPKTHKRVMAFFRRKNRIHRTQ